jgi:hypothetical protein
MDRPNKGVPPKDPLADMDYDSPLFVFSSADENRLVHYSDLSRDSLLIAAAIAELLGGPRAIAVVALLWRSSTFAFQPLLMDLRRLSYLQNTRGLFR